MRTPRTIVVWLLAAGAAAQVLSAADKPRNYKTELRQVQSQQRRKQYRESISLCEKMLAYHKEAWQVQEVTWLKIDCQVPDSQYEAAIKTLASLARAYAADPKVQTAVALRTGDVQRAMKKFPAAVATYVKAAEDCAKTEPDQAAEALLRAAAVTAEDLKKPEDAVALYRQVETRFGARLPKRAAEAVQAIAGVHETQTKDAAQAAAAYQALTEKYAAVYDEHTLSGLYTKAVDCFLKAKKPAAAAAAAKQAETKLQARTQKASFAIRHADVLTAMEKFAEARAQCERIICSYPLEQKSCLGAQEKVVEAWRAESKWPEALGAARVLYDAAGDEQSIRLAAQVVARAMLAADGNLGRANEFLAYQRFGQAGPDGKPGTQDDVATNHLAKVKYPAFGAAANEQFQAAVKAQAANYDGYRARGFLYVYWGKPKEAAASFFEAFKAADLTRMPAAAQELVTIGVKAHTASFRGLDRVFEYISYGPKGKSGKENIPDPFAGLR